jgi:hypothetical protein
MFGWGVGFYGPPIFLGMVSLRTGWSLPLVSAAVTLHFLVGAGVIAFLPRLHRRFGVAACSAAGAVVLACGVMGWATAQAPWQLFGAAVLSGGAWVTLGAVTVNAIIAPWFARDRPRALSRAYNGASIGGAVFSPLWVALIAAFGFPWAAAGVGAALIVTVGAISACVLRRSPQTLGQHADGAAAEPAAAVAAGLAGLPGAALWRDRAFLTLAGAMALGLFAQIGLIAHLYSLLAQTLGAQAAGWAMGWATACAIAGRAVAGRLLTPGVDRRRIAAASYAVQGLGTLILLLAADHGAAAIFAGMALFGLGIGNATSLPPLIAQSDFERHDVARVVALIVAMSQAAYAFAPAVFALLLGWRTVGTGMDSTAYFAAALAIQAGAALCMVAGAGQAARLR